MADNLKVATAFGLSWATMRLTRVRSGERRLGAGGLSLPLRRAVCLNAAELGRAILIFSENQTAPSVDFGIGVRSFASSWIAACV